MAIYGRETCVVKQDSMASLRSGIADAIAYSTKGRSADLVYSVASTGTDADPDIEVAIRCKTCPPL